MTSKQLSYRAAVSLNNMGICTMEHGHFGAAMETLKDSLFIMKNIFLNQLSTAERTTHSLEGSLHEDALQAARMRLAQSQAQPLLNDFLDIQPCDDCNVTAMKIPIVQCQYGPPSSTIFVPIRLGSSSHELPSLEDYGDHTQQEQLEHIFKIPSAIILYNYGLSHIIAHLQELKSPRMTNTSGKTRATAESHESSLLHGGIVCFTMSHGILCQARAAVCAGGAVSFEILQAMLISGLVLRNLFFIFRIKHQVQAAHDVLLSLSSLLYIIQVHEDVLRNMNVELENHKTACAA
jgi:hypothetical protein